MSLTRVYLALGSNLGDRQRFLDTAIQRLRSFPGIAIRQVSPYYETAPVGGPASAGAYLNGVAEADTSLPPDRLLAALLQIELSLGRVRSEPNAPRTLDLDLLLYGDLVRPGPDPIVPHPRLHERRFVLQPLVDLAPHLVHPILHRPMAQLLGNLPADPSPPVVWRRSSRRGDDLAGLRALITGSTSGIGRAIALEFARCGADVIVHGRRSEQAAQAVAEEVRGFGRLAHVVMADLADPNGCDWLVGPAWDLWGGIDIFVQNAGADLLTGDAPHWPFERKLEALWAVDVSATMRLCRSVGERMVRAGAGCILTMGWDQADTGMEGDSGQLFGAAKGAVMAFTRALAKSLAPKVRVNCLAPGWIKTAWGETASDTWQARVIDETPLARWGLPEDVAQMARWLASPSADYITGQIMRINGGAV